MNLDLIKIILVVAMASSIISTAVIQKIKEVLNNKTILYIIAFVVSVAVGFLFSLSFSDLNIINSIWVGLITWVGADAVYKTFEDKIFTSFSNMNKEEETLIERDDL